MTFGASGLFISPKKAAKWNPKGQDPGSEGVLFIVIWLKITLENPLPTDRRALRINPTKLLTVLGIV